ncbi:hypothetical protein LINPERHAP2_LOCUS7743 [Linum perenne]
MEFPGSLSCSTPTGNSGLSDAFTKEAERSSARDGSSSLWRTISVKETSACSSW